VATRGTASRRLIVNADDFGLTLEVNRAILELNRAAVLPSATLMATGPAFRDAVHRAFMQPSLGVGCHVVLVDGTPALHAAELPTLAPGGRFRRGLGEFVQALFAGSISALEIEREATAQMLRIQSSGLTVTHVDTHKHTHIFPRVLVPVLRAARALSIRSIRNPFEPAWSQRATLDAPWPRRLQVRVLRVFRRFFLRAVGRARMLTTDGALGVLATGTLDAEMLRRLMERMPPGTWELVCHPGYSDAALEQAGTRLLGSREVERAALLASFAALPLDRGGIQLMDYGGLTGEMPLR
jgi:predicted glycoside hydrolase/deacetylase ChbG (UPF0249 family)